MGDGLVPDYLTHVEKGAFYGWPYAYIGTHPDPVFGPKRPDMVAKTKTPDLLFQSHSAPTGLVFYEGDQFPAEYKNNIFIAEHGSWNRSVPIGYRVVSVALKNGHAVAEDVFASGWLPATGSGPLGRRIAWGRPVDVQQLPDGSLLVSDDKMGAIYRITYGAVGKPAAKAAPASEP